MAEESRSQSFEAEDMYRRLMQPTCWPAAVVDHLFEVVVRVEAGHDYLQQDGQAALQGEPEWDSHRRQQRQVAHGAAGSCTAGGLLGAEVGRSLLSLAEARIAMMLLYDMAESGMLPASPVPPQW